MNNNLKILIPHDLNNDYLNLIPLINKFESYSTFSEISLYHAYEPPNLQGKKMPETLKSLIKDDEKNIEKILSTQAKIFRKLLNSNTDIKTVFKKNKPVQGITNFTKKYTPDIVMLTTSRQMGIAKYINSSNALKLMNILDIPILIMPRDYEVTRELRLNFLIEYFENYELAKELSKGFTDIFKDIKFIHRDPTMAKESTEEIKVIPSIEEYIKKSKYDEVFMLIRKKKSRLQKALTTGFVDRLVGLNQAPVIIINE